MLLGQSDQPTACEGGVCKSEECCMNLGSCKSSDCHPGRVPRFDAAAFCSNTSCTDAECCAEPGMCTLSTCTKMDYVLRIPSELPKTCQADSCSEDECCTKTRMIYWVEKTGGTIRRCRYDQCTHDKVETVKSGLSLPEGIAFDTKRQRLYWADTDQNSIHRCDPHKCEETTEAMITDVGEPVRLTIDVLNGFLYWSERATKQVMRCPINVVPCVSPEIVVRNGGSGVPYGIAVDPAEQRLYWTGDSQVQRCYVGPEAVGLPCEPKIIAGPLASLAGIVGIALDLKNRKVYWSLKNKVEECPMAPNQDAEKVKLGTDIKLVTNNVDMVRGLAVDSVSSELYMAEGISSGKNSRIRNCNPTADFSCADTSILVSGCPGSGRCMNMPFDIALDWSEATVEPVDKQLPSWATESWNTKHNVTEKVDEAVSKGVDPAWTRR